MAHQDVVYFAADANYLPLAWLAARSAASVPDRRFDVLILVEKGAVRGIRPPAGCRFLEIEIPAEIRAWPVQSHMSIFAYVRLAAPDFWLREYKRGLYLDCDILVPGSLAPLFALELGGALFAMAQDCGHYIRDEAERADFAVQSAALGLDPAATYFNSGAVLTDLAQWRATGCWEQAIGYVRTHGARLRYMDQDAVNFVGLGRTREISPRWNFQTHYFGAGLDAVIAPCIFHYINVAKPWRDAEWAALHGDAAVRTFAELFSRSPWPDFMPAALGGRRPFWRRRSNVAAKRKLPDEVMQGHVAHYRVITPAIHQRFRAGVAAALAAGRYADLGADEVRGWQRALPGTDAMISSDIK
jgi:lipopolysaccharide biosynthesis glycosyltransferase